MTLSNKWLKRTQVKSKQHNVNWNEHEYIDIYPFNDRLSNHLFLFYTFIPWYHPKPNHIAWSVLAQVFESGRKTNLLYFDLSSAQRDFAAHHIVNFTIYQTSISNMKLRICYIIAIFIIMQYVTAYQSEADKEEFMQKGRESYHSGYEAYMQRLSKAAPQSMKSQIRSQIGGEEVYAQHNAEATDGYGFESPENLGFKVLDYGMDGFEQSCIYQIITGKLKIVSVIGRTGVRGYAVDLTVENIGDQAIECNIDMGTVFEQKKYTKAQNLAIQKLTKIKLEKNEVSNNILDAFCIDPSYRSPNGEPMILHHLFMLQWRKMILKEEYGMR